MNTELLESFSKMNTELLKIKQFIDIVEIANNETY